MDTLYYDNISYDVFAFEKIDGIFYYFDKKSNIFFKIPDSFYLDILVGSIIYFLKKAKNDKIDINKKWECLSKFLLDFEINFSKNLLSFFFFKEIRFNNKRKAQLYFLFWV